MTGEDRPARLTERQMRLPKRFYKAVGVEATGDGFQLALDGRGARTPGKAMLRLPTRSLADAVAAEWRAQSERIDPAAMPLTRLANSAIDGVTGRERAVAEDIVAYAASDLLCYRAEAPQGLVDGQRAHWDRILAWAAGDLGARFVVAAGVMPVDQPAPALDAVRAALGGLDRFALAAVHTITTLTGSALLALAHARGRLTAEEAWAAAHVDEDWQISQWGADAEAAARREEKRRAFDAAHDLLVRLGEG